MRLKKLFVFFFWGQYFMFAQLGIFGPHFQLISFLRVYNSFTFLLSYDQQWQHDFPADSSLRMDPTNPDAAF